MEPTPPCPDPLARLRQDIDHTDLELLQLLARRFEAVRQVGLLKGAAPDQPLQDLPREHALQARWLQDAESLGLSAPFARRILKEILGHSRRLQASLLQPSDPGRPRLRCGYQGGPGAHGALAAEHLLSLRSASEVERIAYPGCQEVVEALLAEELDYGFLPVENSISGSILDVNRLICEHALAIVDEEIWAVEQVLAAAPGTGLGQVRAVRSHPAALSQCAGFLRGLEGVAREPWADTASAAGSVAAAKPGSGLAAICSEPAAQAHGLEVLARGIADQPRNETRFLLLARSPERPDPRLACKTSVLFRLNHHEGALARALAVLAQAGANLCRIESRPVPDSPWEYSFFVDVEGHPDAPALAAALVQLRTCCNHLRLLGGYPARAGHQDRHLEQPILAIQEMPLAPPGPSPERAGQQLYIQGTLLGEGQFTLICGPCAVESRSQILAAAAMVQAAGAHMLRGGAFKPRTSPRDFQGLGLEGLRLLQEAGRQSGLATVTEVLTIEDIPLVAEHAAVLQVGARNMHNFALLKELGRLHQPVILKRGMSATVKEFLLAAEYLLAGGNQQVILCERGIRTFETGTRATLDLSAVPALRRLTQLPIIVDPSHAAGDRELVVPLALAAAAVGADGLIVEAHPAPEQALCDRAQALTRADLERMVAGLRPMVAAQGRRW